MGIAYNQKGVHLGRVGVAHTSMVANVCMGILNGTQSYSMVDVCFRLRSIGTLLIFCFTYILEHFPVLKELLATCTRGYWNMPTRGY